MAVNTDKGKKKAKSSETLPGATYSISWEEKPKGRCCKKK